MRAAAGAERGAHRHLAAPRGAARSSRLAMLAQAISSTAADRAEQRDKRRPVILRPARPGTDAPAMPRSCRRAGSRRRRAPAIAVSSACAAASADAGAQPADRLSGTTRRADRPTAPRTARPAPASRSAAGSRLSNGNSKRAGITPTIDERRRRRAPRACRRSPDRARSVRVHSASQITAVRLRRARSSSAREDAAGDRRDAEQRKDVRRDDGHRNRRRLAAAGERHRAGRVGGDVLDGGGLGAPVQDVEIRAAVRFVVNGGVDRDQAGRRPRTAAASAARR